jgi:GNAT superfamily N-acetyltransferase
VDPEIRYKRRPSLDERSLQALFVAGWGEPKPSYERALARSFAWVTTVRGTELIGFVNIAWDGGVHFFLLDTTVHPAWRAKGIGRRLVEEAIDCCRGRGEWLHVDADEEMMTGFYEQCGFGQTSAGLIDLTRVGP